MKSTQVIPTFALLPQFELIHLLELSQKNFNVWKHFLYSFVLVVFFVHNYPSYAEGTKKPKFTSKKRIPLTAVITELPHTGLDALDTAFSKESLPYWGIITGSTAVLYHYDEKVLLYIQEQGRTIGIGNEDNTKAFYQVGDLTARFPTDTGSALYFLGDGWLQIGNAFVFIGYGYFSDDVRAYNTGLQIVHGLTISTIFVQTLKISTGRESPYVRTEDRGAWRPFPSIQAYGSRTAHYDAMPSGHISAATLSFTVLIENYPGYAHILWPVKIIWLSLLGWQMVNNSVHWASDYPLGIAIGYVVGKSASQLGKPPKEKVMRSHIPWIVQPRLGRDAVGLDFVYHY